MIPKTIAVGVLSAEKIAFEFSGNYSAFEEQFSGENEAFISNGKIVFEGKCYDEIIFTPIDENKAFFELKNVVIGINFHWQKAENQSFKGQLKLIVEDERITAVNVLSVEEYLTSVISSEMSATSSLELLKAHAVISRSWLLRPFASEVQFEQTKSFVSSDDCQVIERWYERDKHTRFDVCADDHCQRYQGITKVTTETVRAAVEATCGEVLMQGDAICDARFSKSCGGVTETFDTCWDNRHFDFLESVSDSESDTTLDLTKEEHARAWILLSPKAFCNTTDATVLAQVLNNFDQPTTDFFRWRVEYTEQQLSELVKRRSGIDFGTILDLQPLQRGASGRISHLKIVGTKKTVIVGKELEIRKWLSESHLYSSAFVVERNGTNFVLLGAGWGHGVGLCQIGAALMAHQGYDYHQILAHYYKNTYIKKVY